MASCLCSFWPGHHESTKPAGHRPCSRVDQKQTRSAWTFGYRQDVISFCYSEVKCLCGSKVKKQHAQILLMNPTCFRRLNCPPCFEQIWIRLTSHIFHRGVKRPMRFTRTSWMLPSTRHLHHTCSLPVRGLKKTLWAADAAAKMLPRCRASEALGDECGEGFQQYQNYIGFIWILAVRISVEMSQIL